MPSRKFPVVDSHHLPVPNDSKRSHPAYNHNHNLPSPVLVQFENLIPQDHQVHTIVSQDRKTSHQDAESRLVALEQRAQQLQSQALPPSQPPAPKYKWGDEEVTAEFHRHNRRPTQKQPVSIPPPVRESPQPFDFKFSTPIPTHFNFGGHFTSPPRSGAPEYVKTGERISGLEKAQFTFELPPTAENERIMPRQMNGFQRKENGIKSSTMDKAAQSSSTSQPRPNSQDHRRHQSESISNTFTIITKQEPKDKSLIHKSLPSKSQAYTYQINTQLTNEEPPLSQSFPPQTILLSLLLHRPPATVARNPSSLLSGPLDVPR